MNQLVEIAQIQFEEGLITKIDVDQLKVNKTNLLSELQNVNIGLSQQLRLLKFYMSITPDAEVVISGRIQEGNNYPLSDELMFNQNTNLQLFDKQLELSFLELESIKAAYYPSVAADRQFAIRSACVQAYLA